MAVTVYLFDAHKAVRAVVDGASELIHTEDAWALRAAIPDRYGAKTGEYIGFRCADGKFRLFGIEATTDESGIGRTPIEATDAAVQELADTVTTDVRLDTTDARTAFLALLEGTGWTLGEVTATERTGKVDAYYVETWEALQKARATFNARLDAYYLFDGRQITGKLIDVQKKEPVFRGRILTGGNASDIRIENRGSPKTVMYGAGAATGTTDDPDRVTIADAAWSKANGDPADKPAGQNWIEDEEAVARWGRREGVYVDQSITDAGELLKATWDELQRLKKPTATGWASAQDVEMLAGQDWQKVRLWDLVAVRDGRGNAATTQVIGIDRDYLRPWRTKFKMGDEKEDAKDITRKVAENAKNVAALKRSSAGGRNAAEENKSFIVECMDEITLHTINIQENGQKIQETLIRMTDAEISLTAAQKQLDETVDEVNMALIRLDGAETEIELKVDKGGVIAAINVSSEEIKIKAAKINLDGLVTASQLDARIAELEGVYAQGIATESINAQWGDITNVWLINRRCYWHDADVVTSVKLTKGTTNIRDMYGENHTVISSVSLTTGSGTITYLGD